MDGKYVRTKVFLRAVPTRADLQSTFIDNLCRNLTTFQVVCELNGKQTKVSLPRPDVSTGYEQISEVIYHFVNTFSKEAKRYGSSKERWINSKHLSARNT